MTNWIWLLYYHLGIVEVAALRIWAEIGRTVALPLYSFVFYVSFPQSYIQNSRNTKFKALKCAMV